MPHGDIWVDPTSTESLVARGSLTLSCMPAFDIVTSVWQKGEMTIGEVSQCLKLCEAGCVEAHAIVAQRLRDSIAVDKPK